MALSTAAIVEELTYSRYQKRQREVLKGEALSQDIASISPSTKFSFQHGQWVEKPYEGFAVVSMVSENPNSEQLKAELCDFQEQLKTVERTLGLLYPLPADSFHQTVANTLSSVRYQKELVDTGFKAQYPDEVKAAFEQINLDERSQSIEMDLIGVSVFGSSIGVLGIFPEQTDFERIISFRDQLYSQPNLNQFDVRRTRPFIGHITLGYFGRVPEEVEATELFETLFYINKSLAKKPLRFSISNTELRSYQDLSHFQREAHYPVFHFKETQYDV